MPVNYNLSAQPWLKPADPAGAYAKGFGLGNQAGHVQAQIAMERARLNQEATQQALAITLKQQQVEHENMVEQQKLEVAKAYHQQQTALQAEGLQQKEEMIQQKIKEAASRQMQMERFKQAIANNEDPVRASLALAGLSGTGGLTSKALGIMDERLNPQMHEPQFKQLPDGTWIAWNPGNKNFGVTRIPADKSNQIPLKDLYAQSLKTAQEMGMHIDSKGVKDALYPTLEKSLNELQGMIADRQKGGSSQGEDLPLDWKVLPWPKTKDDLQKGRLYDTPAKGIMYYNRDGKWARPMSPALHQNELSMAGEDQQQQDNTEVANTEDVPTDEETAAS